MLLGATWIFRNRLRCGPARFDFPALRNAARSNECRIRCGCVRKSCWEEESLAKVELVRRCRRLGMHAFAGNQVGQNLSK